MDTLVHKPKLSNRTNRSSGGVKSFFLVSSPHSSTFPFNNPVSVASNPIGTDFLFTTFISFTSCSSPLGLRQCYLGTEPGSSITIPCDKRINKNRRSNNAFETTYRNVDQQWSDMTCRGCKMLSKAHQQFEGHLSAWSSTNFIIDKHTARDIQAVGCGYSLCSASPQAVEMRGRGKDILPSAYSYLAQVTH